MLMAGDITAHGGEVTLHLTNTSRQTTYLADQAIWLNGSIDVSATFIANPVIDDGLLTGNLFNGGQINFNADRGYVVTLADSYLNVSGTIAEMDLPAQVSGATVLSWQRQPVAAAAGGISIDAAEGPQKRQHKAKRAEEQKEIGDRAAHAALKTLALP